MNRSGYDRWRIGFLALALLAPIVAGCGDGADAPDGLGDEEPATLVVTIHPIASIVEQLLGEAATVHALVDPGQSPHHAELPSNALGLLTRADAVVTIGLGLDDWAEDAAKRVADRGLAFIRCGQLLGLDQEATRPNADHNHANHDHNHAHAHHDHDDDDGAAGHGHGHGAIDPHVWVDPVLARTLTARLAARLRRLMPGHAATIDANAAALDRDLADLDAAFADALAPFQGAAIVTYHSAFNRLAERYGLTVAATLSPVETPGAMTLKARQRAIDAVDRHDLRVIFAEPQFPDAAAQALRRAAGGKLEVLTLDPLGDPRSDARSTYQSMMRYNLSQLVKGLRLNADARRDADDNDHDNADAHDHRHDGHDHVHDHDHEH